MRDRWPALAEEWQRALAIAWEQVEMRMLSTLLDGDATEINARVALEMLKRRKGPAERPMLTISAKAIERVRSDIRALAAPED
jgi:RecJ-like exonuclease